MRSWVIDLSYPNRRTVSVIDNCYVDGHVERRVARPMPCVANTLFSLNGCLGRVRPASRHTWPFFRLRPRIDMNEKPFRFHEVLLGLRDVDAQQQQPFPRTAAQRLVDL